jgi:hypothetical protein
VVVLLARGGWRRRANVALAGGAFLVLAAPWLAVHFANQQELVRGATTIADGTAADREVWTLENFAWYGWAVVNLELLLPLAAIAATALGTIGWRAAKRRAVPPYSLELVVTAVVGFLLQAIFLTQDARYTMPCLVFAAVLVAGWLTMLPRHWSRAVIAVIAVTFVVNTVAVTFGVGHRLAFAFPNADTGNVLARQLVVYSPDGYAGAGGAQRSVDYVGLFDALRDDGARRFAIAPGSVDNPEVPHALLTTVAQHVAGLDPVAPEELRRGDALLVAHARLPDEPPGCMTTPEGRSVWVVRGPRGAFTCPPGFPR